MSSSIRKHAKEINFLCNCTRAQRKQFIRITPQKNLSSILKALSQISDKLLYDKRLVSQLSIKQRKKLKRFIPALRRLARGTYKSKKSVLNSQKGGSLLSVLWNTVKSIFT